MNNKPIERDRLTREELKQYQAEVEAELLKKYPDAEVLSINPFTYDNDNHHLYGYTCRFRFPDRDDVNSGILTSFSLITDINFITKTVRGFISATAFECLTDRMINPYGYYKPVKE